MAHAQLDVAFYDQRKFLWLYEHHPADAMAAIGMWSVLVGWARGHVDPDDLVHAGEIPAYLPTRMCPDGNGAHLAALLAEARLLDRRQGGGWSVHNFARRQQLGAWQARREAGMRGHAKRYGQTGPDLFSDQAGSPAGSPAGSANGSASGSPAGSASSPPTGHTYIQTDRQTTRVRADPMSRFADFWDTYAHKASRPSAEAAWKRAVQGGKGKRGSSSEYPPADPAVIIAGARRYAATRNPQYVKHPATWLNNRCWEDETPDPAAVEDVPVWTPNT